MRKLALGLASAGAFAAITVGMASPAYATPNRVTEGHDAVHATQPHVTSVQPVDCHVVVNHLGNDVDVSWC